MKCDQTGRECEGTHKIREINNVCKISSTLICEKPSVIDMLDNDKTIPINSVKKERIILLPKTE